MRSKKMQPIPKTELWCCGKTSLQIVFGKLKASLLKRMEAVIKIKSEHMLGTENLARLPSGSPKFITDRKV